MNAQRRTEQSPVVAGFDVSPSAASALDVAATEAMARSVPLLVVHAYPWPVLYATLANLPYRADDWHAPAEVAESVRAAGERLARRFPGLVVQTSVRAGTGAEILLEASADASLVVLGARGATGLGGLLAGSVATAVTAHAACPVMVVRAGQRTGEVGGHVCVGMDGSPSSLKALRFACRWACRHGADVWALYAVGADAFDRPAPEFAGHTPAQQRLDDWIEEIDTEWPGVRIEPVVVRRDAADALLAGSAAARLLIVGSRHRGELRSLMLGSVGHSLIRRSTCPVVVVHGEPAEPAAPLAVAAANTTG
jgi:nucleotide-binding universal stress UspA family protein